MERSGPDSVRAMEVIEVTFSKGEGVDHDPVRMATRYYDLEGNLLAEYDPFKKE